MPADWLLCLPCLRPFREQAGIAGIRNAQDSKNEQPDTAASELERIEMTANDDEREIIDVVAEEIVEGNNLPAVVETPVRTYRSDEPIQPQRHWPHGPSPERRCVAHRKNGEQCKNAAIKGATVCRYHGGAAPHVKRAARARLENAADLMAEQLLRIALTAEGEGVKLAAIKDALDRAGLRAPSEVVLSQGEAKPYEAVFDSIGGTPPESGSDSIEYGAAGNHSVPPAMVDQAGYGDGGPEYVSTDEVSASSSEGSEVSRDESPRRARPSERDRDRQPQARELHITGEDAMRIANEANRASGALPPLRELESPHKRYRRP